MFFLDGQKLSAFKLYMQRLSCLDLTDITFDVIFKPGTLQAEDGLPIKLAWHNDVNARPSTQFTPSTVGISSVYTPCLSVVLLTENVICSMVLGELTLNLHCI